MASTTVQITPYSYSDVTHKWGYVSDSRFKWYQLNDVINLYIPVIEYDGVWTANSALYTSLQYSGSFGDGLLPMPGAAAPAVSSLEVLLTPNAHINASNLKNLVFSNGKFYLKNMTSEQMWGFPRSASYQTNIDYNIYIKDSNGNFWRCRVENNMVYSDHAVDIRIDSEPSGSTLGSIYLLASYNPYYPSGYTAPGNLLIDGTNSGYNSWYQISSDIAKNIEILIKNDNPYGGGEDQPKGGTGDRKNWDGETPLYDVPTANILDLGMCSVYAPTEAQLNSFSEFLWSDAFSVDTLKKIVADPMDAIISAHMLPFSVTHGLQSQIMIGNIGSGVNADVLGAQFYKKDMGTLAIDEYYGNFFDYSPYTKYSIYLPYIGYEEFIPDDFVGGSMTVTYYIDAITGKCTACLYSSKHKAILYQYEGNMLYQVPITAGNYANAILGVASAGIRAAGAIISGGKSVITNVAGAAVSGVAASKPDISRSGGLGGASGWLGYQEPFIIRIRPNGVIAKNQQSYTGFPSYQAKKLSSLSGYTVVHDINLSLNGATESEYTEAENLLKTGVII